ncbi:hypothetical protein ACEQ8H_005101 [Pleosporales sp. CAS-2024a]
MARVQAPQPFDWAHDAFVALDGPAMPKPDNWPPAPPSTCGIPPSLLTAGSVQVNGIITPTQSPPQEAREGSIPVEQLRNEALWPQHSPPQQNSLHQPSPKPRRAARESSLPHSHLNAPSDQHDHPHPQPPKRKRGRPKSQPQMVEAYTADGYPFQVSSARQSHLEKNRVAAHKCRQRKKEYINSLEDRARDFSSKNKALKENVAMLREEVLGLKNEVLRHAACGFWAVDEYLARCAGDLLGMEAPTRPDPMTTHQQSPNMTPQQYMGQRHDSHSSVNTSATAMSSPHLHDDFGGLELLRDYDEEMEEHQ